MSQLTSLHKPLPIELFAILGASRLGYIKTMRSEELASRYPGTPVLPAGNQIFVLHSADGAPVSVMPNRESAIASAAEHQIETASLH
jgi:hypothetical protein